uniref:Uncharacterized protein K02A2.6-like n=1 Tax=Nicotiana sylvestris TaxID=4096 RepID=A0A1U7XZZ4_NICSY|nr:PREDICTED: uncharacterized protein K02A2.6-like [Nicotiana sylvestris]
MCVPHMNDYTLAMKILKAEYFWMTMESDSICYVQKCHWCQICGDFIWVLLNQLNVIGSPWPFAAWGMDMIIGPIEPATLNGHCFILEDINYFTKWVEASTCKAITKKVVADFVCNNIVYRFRIPESIITGNIANLNNNFMRDICEKFNIVHRNSTTYKPQMNGAVEEANKNIKRMLRKIVDNHMQWHKKISFSLLGYHTTNRTSTGATPYMLVYGTEDVIPIEVQIPSLRVIQEAKLDNADAEWIHVRYFIVNSSTQSKRPVYIKLLALPIRTTCTYQAIGPANWSLVYSKSSASPTGALCTYLITRFTNRSTSHISYHHFATSEISSK